MFRNPQGKILRHMFDHAVIHDLDDAPAAEKGYIFLLMSASGMPAQPDGSYATNGSMRIQFPDLPAAFDALRSRGYLAEPNPPEATIAGTLVPELKELLRAHNLPVSGKRAELIERLIPALSEDEFAELAEKHRICYPSALGFEMIYSLYDLWERRQIALMEAISSGNNEAILDAYKHMPNSVEFWDDSPTAAPIFHANLQQLSNFSLTSSAFAFLCGFSPEFNIRELPAALRASSVYTRITFVQSLDHYRASGLTKVRWHSCGFSAACDALDGKVFYIDSVPDCPVCPGCSCWVTGVVELPGENIPVAGGSTRPAKPVPSRSSVSFKQYTFSPLPDPDPASVPREKNYKAWIVFGIIAAIVIAALFFFV